MKVLKVGFVLVLAAVVFSGCAVPVKTTTDYSAPDAPRDIENRLVVESSFDDTWGKLIAGLSSEFFVINNIEKASGLITLDFSSEHPEQFVDCGVTTRHYGDQTFTYQAAGDSDYLADKQSGVNVARMNVHRDAALTGKINVHVAEVSDGTQVSVNARYIWTVVAGGTYKMAGSISSGPTQAIPQSTTTKSFNTRSASKSNGPEDPGCGATGELERMILDIVR